MGQGAVRVKGEMSIIGRLRSALEGATRARQASNLSLCRSACWLTMSHTLVTGTDPRPACSDNRDTAGADTDTAGDVGAGSLSVMGLYVLCGLVMGAEGV